jgi:hypothetical protein
LKDNKELYCKINKKITTNYFEILLLHKIINKKFLLTSGHWKHDDELSSSKVQSWSWKMGRGNVATMAKQNHNIFN